MYYSNLDRIFDSFLNENNGMYKTYKIVSANQNEKIDDSKFSYFS